MITQGPAVIPAAERSLLETVERLADAERSGDLPALEAVLAVEYQGYDPAGRPQDRSGVLSAYAERRVRIASLRLSGLRARVVGDVGLVAGIAALTGEQGAERFDFRLRFLDAYVRREGRWQLLASQDTRLPR